MYTRPWRERREAYLRERGRLADLWREGYTESRLAVIQGGARCVPADNRNLILIAGRRRMALRLIDSGGSHERASSLREKSATASLSEGILVAEPWMQAVQLVMPLPSIWIPRPAKNQTDPTGSVRAGTPISPSIQGAPTSEWTYRDRVHGHVTPRLIRNRPFLRSEISVPGATTGH
jgi:hypothetical protein